MERVLLVNVVTCAVLGWICMPTGGSAGAQPAASCCKTPHAVSWPPPHEAHPSFWLAAHSQKMWVGGGLKDTARCDLAKQTQGSAHPTVLHPLPILFPDISKASPQESRQGPGWPNHCNTKTRGQSPALGPCRTFCQLSAKKTQTVTQEQPGRASPGWRSPFRYQPWVKDAPFLSGCLCVRKRYPTSQ